MEYVAQSVQATFEVVVPGVAFDSAVEDAVRRMVSTILASSPTPVDSRRRERVRLMFNVVWMGNEMQTSSGWESTHLVSPVNAGFAAPEAECLGECRPSIDRKSVV